MSDQGATDLHANHGGTAIRILGGDFAVKSLKRQIRIFDQNALTNLRIKFEYNGETNPNEGASVPAQGGYTEQKQKFVFPFSDDKTRKFIVLITVDIFL